ncbi:oxygen-independent coproporphyrinogen III oxidase [Agaribacter marinus]|uniref:Coproporphyrinogen-III oxidase n=1 Tax=Agaribacter marinus TaxID=1431249 RepID=A0AA37SUQ9_9ALTE|nr:oxygen-independent coproporphyrinogen III oxidase [Agaribacter marinus]GLR69763.1 coproporphyrinogen-III oxidase [Agaribacter marinus]
MYIRDVHNTIIPPKPTTNKQPQTLDFLEKAVLQKYNVSGPRYTSYPTAVSFHPDISTNDIDDANNNLLVDASSKQLSLYVHIPFCNTLCYYCGCNKIVTRQQDKADRYIEYLEKEIDLVANSYEKLVVADLHLGGGTPNFLSVEQLSRLIASLKQAFNFANDAQLSIEIDPRTADQHYLKAAAKLGFNRLSIGLQDTDKRVQRKINRTQSTLHIANLIKAARMFGYKSINVDVIYGLPMQTHETFSNTLNAVKNMDPERISLFSYAHMPNMFAAQRKIKNEWLPSSEEKFALFTLAINVLTQSGYDFIGMDHFAKPSDELSVVQREKLLHRNFQGYSTQGRSALLGLGVSSISSIDKVYFQNEKHLNDYYAALDKNNRPIAKGVVLSTDDQIRRDLILQLMCNFEIDKQAFSEKHNIDFNYYFKQSLSTLETFVNDALVSNDDDKLTIHSKGRLLVRNICMSFDQYLSQPMHQMRYSSVI